MKIVTMKYDEVISLGFDCTIARMLKSYGLRNTSYPIDWTVSRDWNLVVDSFVNNKKDEFINIEMIDGFYRNPMNIEFLHHSQLSKEEFKKIFTARYEKLYDIMTNDKQILFLRKSHDLNNCSKTIKTFNEVDETVKLCNWMNSHNKNFKFVLFLSCPACHSNVTYTQIDNLEIIKKKESLEIDSFGHYNKDIEDYIRNYV